MITTILLLSVPVAFLIVFAILVIAAVSANRGR